MIREFIEDIRFLDYEIRNLRRKESCLKVKCASVEYNRETLEQGLAILIKKCDHMFPLEYNGEMNTKSKYTAVGMKTQCCRICKQFIKPEEQTN